MDENNGTAVTGTLVVSQPEISSREAAVSAYATAARRLLAAHAAVQQNVDRNVGSSYEQIAALLSDTAKQSTQGDKTSSPPKRSLFNGLAHAMQRIAISDIAAAAGVADAASEAASMVGAGPVQRIVIEAAEEVSPPISLSEGPSSEDGLVSMSLTQTGRGKSNDLGAVVGRRIGEDLGG